MNSISLIKLQPPAKQLALTRLPQTQAGFTYLALLLMIFIMGISAAIVGTIWHTEQKRIKEAELLFVGGQYRRAISRYYAFADTTGRKHFPSSLEALLKDPRQPGVVRHLRKQYVDPITGSSDWGVVNSPEGGIAGVYSKSEQAPIKTGNFRLDEPGFDNQKKYSDWKFIAKEFTSS